MQRFVHKICIPITNLNYAINQIYVISMENHVNL